MKSIRWLIPALAVVVLVAARGAMSEKNGIAVKDALYPTARALRVEGIAQKAGNGTTRAYVLVDQKTGKALEIGVALSEGVMDGLPKPMQMSAADMASMEHMDMHTWNLELPANNPTPFKYVSFGWNPRGHEPPGVWDVPHFDFHFYTVPPGFREAIVPTEPDFAVKAASLPPAEFRPPFYVDNATAAGLPAALVTVPRMGLHWVDVRSPELQAALGNPAGFQPFSKTFFIGSWDGRFIFGEPMITRAYLLAKRAGDAGDRDEVTPIPTAAEVLPAGFYPTAYRIAYDSRAHEFLVGLTGLTRME